MATDLITTALSRLKAGSTQVEFIHKPHIGWPHPPHIPHSLPAPGSPLATAVSKYPVAVLDSSFNPPTLAHRALALLPAASSATDARLLLLSVRNADKVPYPGDASLVQRVEMMVLLAREVNAAVGLVDAPAFVHKAELLRAALPAGAQLTFLQGVDTLERFLAPRYYGDGSTTAMHAALRHFFAPDGNDSRVICARRTMELVDPRGETAILEAAREWVQANRINITDIDNKLQTFSSSEVRAKVRAGDSSWRQMVPNGIVEYIEQHNLYLDLT
ncbi:Nucleotidylyl transferase [Russula ochroleuca]|uniref:Nucleotidylyl transferase n=1 Tax=Russula ochroleuca TaxID=152965 RepID=A0A9P5N4V8_9AGAM|nr:Nucleotidylyl transferase [Russula ochroleuca]